MAFTHWRERAFACVLLSLSCSVAHAAVEPLFDLAQPQTAPAPSNRFTSIDPRNLTNLQVSLPKPDCTQRPSDCQDIDVLNTLDGFNLQPRLRIPFSGAIDPASVNSSNVFLVKLGDTTRFELAPRQFVGINQVVWDPASNTLFAESDELLDEHTAYALIVTDGIRDTQGHAISGNDFRRYWLSQAPGYRSAALPDRPARGRFGSEGAAPTYRRRECIYNAKHDGGAGEDPQSDQANDASRRRLRDRQ